MSKNYIGQLYSLIHTLDEGELGELLASPMLDGRIHIIIKKLYSYSTCPKNLFSSDFGFSGQQQLEQLFVYSFEFILDYLRGQKQNLRFELLKMIENIKILNRRKQSKACQELLAKAKKLAENNDALLEEYDIILTLEFGFFSNQISELDTKILHQNRIITKTKITNNWEYNTLGIRLFELMRRQVNHENVGQQIQALGKSDLLQDESRAISLRAKIVYNQCQAFIQERNRDYQKSIFYSLRIVELYEQNPSYIKEHMYRYIHALLALNCQYTISKEYEKGLATSQKIRFLYQQYDVLQNKFEGELSLYSYHFDIEIFNKELRLEEATALIPKIEKALFQLKTRLPLTHQTGLLYEIAETYFFSKKYRDSLKYIKLIFSHNREKGYVDGQIMGRFLELLVYIELGHKSTLQERVIQIKHYLKEQKVYFRYEAMFISLVEDFIKADDDPQKTRAVYAEYLFLFQSIEDLIEQDSYFDMTVWLQSKIQGRCFLKIKKQKIQIDLNRIKHKQQRQDKSGSLPLKEKAFPSRASTNN